MHYFWKKIVKFQTQEAKADLKTKRFNIFMDVDKYQLLKFLHMVVVVVVVVMVQK